MNIVAWLEKNGNPLRITIPEILWPTKNGRSL